MAELIWDGKYDRDVQRRAPVKLALPFQTVETVNESVQERQRSLELSGAARDSEWRNRLIWGDKKYVLPSLLPEFAGKVDLIYIDPPFDTGADFSFTANVPGSPRNPSGQTPFEKAPSILEQKAYRDTWGRGLDSYLEWFSDSALILRELLADNGTIFVHLDWHVSFYAKAVLDEVFGADRFVNEIVWKRQTAKADVAQGAKHLGRIHETILLYSKSENRTWNTQYTVYDQSYVDAFYRYSDADGRRYQLSDITAPGGAKEAKGNPRYEFLGVTRFWRFSQEMMQKLHEKGRIVQTAPGTVPRQKRYLDEMPGVPLQSLWLDIKPVQSQSSETVSYATQKPEALLERILKLSSNPGNLVLDCFVGSGTTATVAEKLDRRWIACDLGRFAVHTTRKRLLGIPNVKPFVVQNLGKYERQAWQTAEFPAGEQDESERQVAREAAYRGFILELYHASPISGNAWLHGIKSGRMVHVGAVDAPVTRSDVKSIAKEVWKSAGSGAGANAAVDVLGWDFAFELNETVRETAAAARVDVRFKRIPRDALDKRAVEAGDVQFFELGGLTLEREIEGQTINLKLADFVIPPDDVPEEARKAIKHWSQMIDYWAVDWDFRGDTFHNQWQAYRTPSNPGLELNAEHAYGSPGEYVILVKVIDILGNDTTKALKVKVAAPKRKGVGA